MKPRGTIPKGKYMNEINKLEQPEQALTTTEETPLVKNKGGRPKGAKNKDTLFKELMSGRFQERAKSDIERVYTVLFDKAHNR